MLRCLDVNVNVNEIQNSGTFEAALKIPGGKVFMHFFGMELTWK